MLKMPETIFRPAAGFVDRLILPAGLGVRIESGLYPQYEVPPFYDSMVAKIIVHQSNPDRAFKTMDRALMEVVVEGLATNIDLLQALIDSDAVQANQFHTKWLEESFLPGWLAQGEE